MRKQCIITIERQLPVYRAVEVPKQGGGDYPAALPVTAPHPAPCGAAAPAVPAARCRRLSISLSAVSLAHSARAVLPISKSKGRGASPLPLRPAPVPAPVCAALLRWMGGLVGGYPAPLFLRPGRRGSTSELQRSHEEDDGANTQ